MNARYLNFDDRKKLEQLYLDGKKVSEIANELKVHESTIYRELDRGSTGSLDNNGRIGYSSEIGQLALQSSLKHQKTAFKSAKN